MSSTISLSFILHKTQTQTHTPVVSTFTSTNSISLSTPRTSHFHPLTPTNRLTTHKSRHVSSRLSYAAADSQPEDEEEEVAVGDCLVYEEGIFDDPYLQTTPNWEKDAARVRKSTNKDTSVSPENLIPEKWLEIQKELNITKKERRKLSQQLEYGKSVEKRRLGLMPINSEGYGKFKQEKLQHLNPLVLDKISVEKRRRGLMPINSEEYEKFKQEKLQQLKPLVLDKPDPKLFEKKDEKGEEERREEEIRGRVAPRNPRLALVYGGGLEDISAHFSSGSYDPAATDKSQGPRKLFSQEEKLLMNRRVPDLKVATSGKWHPLHALAASGEFYLLNTLLKHTLNINVPDKHGLTAIHKAILGKKQAIFNFLLRESANPFVRDNEGATLMHYAVFSASAQMIKILLLYNVDINLQDNDGWTPLHLAVQSRRTDVVRLLLIKGADQTLKNRGGLSALDLCLYSGRDTRTYELIRLLKRYPK